jgi:tetratricopeptide (TPR) repeat protein/transglutaminase-like putative cysteine protease
MKLHVLGSVLAVLLFAGCVTTAQNTTAEGIERGELPWETAFLNAPPGDVIRASADIKLEKEQDARILYRECMYSFDQDGRLTWNFRIVYKILTANGVSYWSSVSQGWDPWYQEKPVFRGRVCNPDGSQYLLKPEHFVESAEKEDDVNVFSERRYLRAPLPNVTIGSVIELEYTVQEKIPYFKDGMVQYVDIRGRNPMYRQKIIIEVAAGLPFNYRIFKQSGLVPTIKNLGAVTRYSFDFENIPPEDEFEPARSVEEPFWPCIAFSTGKSWQTVARTYNTYIEGALKDQDFSGSLAGLKAGDVRQSAVNIIKWLNKRVRYTGLELGINSIVPAQPSQTLSRGFGDCKDKATLVVGMLRQMGYKARVALVSAGFGLDTSPDLPGLGHFNHAIVYVDEQGGLWFDPTAEYSRDSYFPISIQNRMALIIDPETTGLVNIPKQPAEINKVIRKKEVFLQNDGNAEVTETTVHYGAEEDYMRASMAQTSGDNLKKNIDDYIKAKFGAGTLQDFTVTNSSDLSVPYTIVLKIKDVERAATQLYLAQVVINQAEIFSYIPSIFLNELKEDRKQSFVFYEPNEFEIRYIIHPPLGFVPRALPPDDTLSLGTMALSRRFTAKDDDTVEVSLKLNTGRDEISASEFMTTHTAIADFLKQQQMLVEFDHKGLLLLKKGNYKDSLAFFYELTEREPANPLHRIRYAFALLQAGLGEKARSIVKQAADSSPESADVFAAQAWILEHDILGRMFQAGYDREGALQAYKKALELDKDNIDYHINLGALLEYNAEGYRFDKGDDLPGAIKHYRYVYDTLNFKDIRNNLIGVLLQAERYEELLKLARDIEDNDLRTLITIVALSGGKGMDAGLRELEKINSVEKRKSIELEASRFLLRVRHYKDAALLLRNAARYSSDAMQLDSQADVYQRLEKHEELTFDKNDPESLLKNYLHAFFTAQGDDFSALKQYVTDDFYANGLKEDNPYNFSREYNIFKNGVISSDLTKDVCLDLYFGLLKLNREGNKEDGYRIVLRSADNSGGGCFYIKNIGGGLKIVANQFFVSAIGKQVYDFYLNHQQKQAEKWLDWYYEDFALFQTNAKEVFQGRPFQKFWNPGNRNIKLAAACIMAEGAFAKQAEPLLLAAYKQAETDTQKYDLDYALQLVYLQLDRYDDQVKVLARLYEAYPKSDKIFKYYLNALISLGEYTRAERIIAEHLADDPAEKQAQCMLLRNYAYKLDFKALEEQMHKCIELNALAENEYNLVAWVELFNSTPSPKALEYARTAMKLSGEKEDYIIHTMATLYAEVGRCQEAWQLINKVMETSGNSMPANEDWYVFGRIAEQYGEIDEAITAYKRIKPPQNRPKDNISTYNLAQKRLRMLKHE